MKNFFIKDLKEGMSLFGEDFAVKSIVAATMKDGRTFYNVELADKTGSISGKIWPDAIVKVDLDSEGKIASIDASIEKYKDSLQIKINSLKKSSDYNEADYQTTSNFDIEGMWHEVEDYRNKIKNQHLKKLLQNIFDPETVKTFCQSAAGVSVHHAYQGGLVEHTLEMLRMSESLNDSYPKLNKDILITGIILHDIGKIFEYETGLIIKISTRGKLLGHIYIGSEIVKTNTPENFPEDLLDELIHIILSHHGELEFGSPVRPRTPEAIAISMFDNASAKINASYNMIHELDEGTLFTNFHRQLGTELYRSPYLDKLLNEDLPF